MGHYFFLSSAMPQLELGHIPDMTFLELLDLYKTNLTSYDWKKVTEILRYIDLVNVRHLLKKEPLNFRGNYDEKELDEMLLNKHILPLYLFDLFDEFENEKEQIAHYSRVFSYFFREQAESQTGFLRVFFQFEREWRLVLTCYRAKKRNRDLLKELQYEDAKDPFVAQLLAQKDSPQFEFPFEYRDLGELLTSSPKHPLEEYRLMASYRFAKVEEFSNYQIFSLDWLLSYMIRLMIVEEWNELNDEKGKEHLMGIA